MLEENVDLFIGSHDSATREALVATIKGKVPYIYTPVYEGGECAFNTYVLADTPEQQIRPSLTWMMKEKGAKSIYMIGDDYVWPRKCNEHAKQYIAENGGKVAAEEYVPFGAPNKFEEVVTRIKSAKPDAVLITLVGADNVNFNRTFAGFGLDKDIARLSLLLEENTLLGVGAESSKNLYSSMSYYANAPGEANKKFKQAYFAKFGDKAPQLSLIGADCYAGVYCAKALDHQGERYQCAKMHGGVRGNYVRFSVGSVDHARPPRRQDNVLGRLQGHRIRYHQDFRRREKRRRVQGLTGDCKAIGPVLHGE